MKKTGIFLIGLILMAGCGMSVPMQKVVVESKYSMEVPTFLVKATGLNDEASLQYKNDSLNFFVIVIDEKKQDVFDAFVDNDLTKKYTSDFNGYSNLIFNGNTELQPSKKSAITKCSINKLAAKKMSFDAKFDGKEEFIYIGLIEGKDRFYQIMAWTHKEKMDNYKKVMDKMMDSFIELQNPQ